MHPQRILYPVEMGHGDEGLPWLAALAERFDAPVVLLHTIDLHFLSQYGDPFDMPRREELRAHAESSAKRHLERLRSAPLLADRAVEIRVVATEDVADAIVAAARPGDWIVTGSATRHGCARALLGSVAEHVVVASPVPVWVLPYGAVDRPPSIEHVVAATDFSEASRTAARAAAALATAFGGRVTLAHCAAVPSPATTSAPVPTTLDPAVERALEERLRADAHELAEAGCPAETALLRGRAPVELLEHVERTAASLLVLAPHGRHGVADRLLGGVTQRVLRHTKTPVVVVPSARA